VTSLQTSVTSLQSANTSLQSALDAEIAARIAGDKTLQSAVTKLQADLATATSDLLALDFLLNASLNAETVNRTNADNALNALIQGLKTAGLGAKVFATSVDVANVPNGDLTIVATLGSVAAPLPAGRYLLTAKGWVYNPDHTAVWGCRLYVADPNNLVDAIVVSTESGGVNATNSSAAIALEGVITLAQPGQVNMQCLSGEATSTVEDIKLIALQVI